MHAVSPGESPAVETWLYTHVENLGTACVVVSVAHSAESLGDRERRLNSSLLEPTLESGEGLPVPSLIVAILRTCMKVKPCVGFTSLACMEPWLNIKQNILPVPRCLSMCCLRVCLRPSLLVHPLAKCLYKSLGSSWVVILVRCN